MEIVPQKILKRFPESCGAEARKLGAKVSQEDEKAGVN